MEKIKDSDLILNKDGSVYHLNLLPGDIANTIITVGDQERVSKISALFDRILFKKSNREFVTHTGELGGKLLTVISTGIGTDNIDIVINELDALVNIDLYEKTIKPVNTALDIIRIGTSGSMQESIPVGSLLISSFAIGLDGLLMYYKQIPNQAETALAQKFQEFCDANLKLPMNYYITQDSPELDRLFGNEFFRGITVTCPGFYAPQGRKVRALNPNPDFLTKISEFNFEGFRTTNFEMETSGIYGLGRILGHRCISTNAIVANRKTGKFSDQPEKDIQKLIETVLGTIA